MNHSSALIVSSHYSDYQAWYHSYTLYYICFLTVLWYSCCFPNLDFVDSSEISANTICGCIWLSWLTYIHFSTGHSHRDSNLFPNCEYCITLQQTVTTRKGFFLSQHVSTENRGERKGFEFRNPIVYLRSMPCWLTSWLRAAMPFVCKYFVIWQQHAEVRSDNGFCFHWNHSRFVYAMYVQRDNIERCISDTTKGRPHSCYCSLPACLPCE